MEKGILILFFLLFTLSAFSQLLPVVNDEPQAPMIVDLFDGSVLLDGKEKTIEVPIYTDPIENSKKLGTAIFTTVGSYKSSVIYKSENEYGGDSFYSLYSETCGGRLFSLHTSTLKSNDFYYIRVGSRFGWVKGRAYSLLELKDKFPIHFFSSEGHELDFISIAKGNVVFNEINTLNGSVTTKMNLPFKSILSDHSELNFKFECQAKDELKIVQERSIGTPDDKFKEPIIVDFMDGIEKRNEKISCWDDSGAFSEKRCEIEKYLCTMEKQFKNYPQTDLQIFPNDKIRDEKPGMNTFVKGVHNGHASVQESGPLPWLTGPSDVPVGAEAILYVNKFRSFSIYWRGKIPMNGVINVDNVLNPFQKIIFVPKNKDALNEFPTQVQLFGNTVGRVGMGFDSEFIVPEGVYEFEIKQVKKDQQYGKKYKVNVPKKSFFSFWSEPKPEVIEVDIERLGLIEKENYEETFAWNDHLSNTSITSLGFKKEGGSPGRYIITKVKSFKLAEGNIDLTKFFDLKNGSFQFKDKKGFLKAINDKPIYTVKFNGECAKTNVRIIYKKLDIFDQPTPNAKKLGILVINHDKDGLNGKFQDGSSEPKKFHNNMHTGLCRDSREYLLHHAREVQNGLVNLGPGPWGQNGWARVGYFGLFSTSPFEFDWLGNGNWLKFEMDAKKNIFAYGHNLIGAQYGDIENETIRLPVNYSDLFNEKGDLNLELNCNYGD